MSNWSELVYIGPSCLVLLAWMESNYVCVPADCFNHSSSWSSGKMIQVSNLTWVYMFELGVNYLNSGHFSGFVAMAPLVALSLEQLGNLSSTVNPWCWWYRIGWICCLRPEDGDVDLQNTTPLKCKVFSLEIKSFGKPWVDEQEDFNFFYFEGIKECYKLLQLVCSKSLVTPQQKLTWQWKLHHLKMCFLLNMRFSNVMFVSRGVYFFAHIKAVSLRALPSKLISSL